MVVISWSVSESNAWLWIVCTLMVQEFYRLGVLLGAGVQL